MRDLGGGFRIEGLWSVDNENHIEHGWKQGLGLITFY